MPGLLLPLLTSYAPPRLRVPPVFMFVAMLAGTGLPIVWMILGARAGGLDTAHYPLHWEPMYVGVGATVLVWTMGRLLSGQGQKP